MVLVVPVVQLVPEDIQEKTVRKEKRVTRDTVERRENVDTEVRKEIKAAKVSKVDPEKTEPWAQLVPLDNPELVVNMANKDYPDLLV